MTLLPYKKFTMSTALSKQKVTKILSENTEKEPFLRINFSGFLNLFAGEPKPFFYGEVFEDSFKIYRHRHKKGSFVPYLHGKIESMGENGAGTLIHIKSSLHPLLLLLFALSPIIMAMGAFSTEGIRAIPLVIPIFAFFYFVVTISFSIEENRAEQKLQELLYAAILN